MSKRYLMLAVLVAASAPGIAAGFNKLELFRSIGLAEGEWITTYAIEDVTVTPGPANQADPATADKARALLSQKGRVQETTDCLGNNLAANGDLILPGAAIAASCPITSQNVSSGDFAFTAMCGDKLRTTVTFEAAKTSTTIDGTVNINIESEELSTAIRTRFNSRRVRACDEG